MFGGGGGLRYAPPGRFQFKNASGPPDFMEVLEIFKENKPACILNNDTWYLTYVYLLLLS